MITQIVTGDDAVFTAQLKKDDSTFSIDAGATVKAMLVSLDRTTSYSAVVTLSSSTTGSDWVHSLVIVVFSAAETTAITNLGSALLEVQVDDTIKETFFGAVTVIQGQIP